MANQEQTQMDRLAEQITQSLNNSTDSTLIEATTATPPSPPSAPPPPAAPSASLSSSPAPATNPIAGVSKPAAGSTAPDEDLGTFVSKLTPKQLAKVRKLAAAEGIAPGARKGPHGGRIIEFEIDVDCISQLETWAESAGKSFEEQTKELLSFLLTGYLNGAWGAPAEANAPTAAVTA